MARTVLFGGANMADNNGEQGHPQISHDAAAAKREINLNLRGMLNHKF